MLQKATAGKKGEIRAHHLIEQRFHPQIGGNVKEWPSIVVTRAEHKAFTDAWKEAIPYRKGTRDATRQEVEDAARHIYKDYPEILTELGLG